MNKIIDLFLKRPLLVNVAMLAIVIIGIFSLYTMNRQLFPNVKMDIIFITTVYPGASPQEVEENVTRHIEDELVGISGIKTYKSYSTNNISSIVIEIDPDSKNAKFVIDRVRQAVDRVTGLPKGVDGRPIIDEFDAGDIPIMEVAIMGKKGKVDYGIIRSVAKSVSKGLEKLPEVKQIDKVGYRDKEIFIDADPQKLVSNYLTIKDLLWAINQQNVRIQGGAIETKDTIKYIMTLSQFDNADDIKEVIVRNNYSGKKIKLSDLAKVNRQYEKEKVRNRVNKRPGISMVVVKKEGHDQIDLSDKVKEYVNAVNNNLPKEIKDKVEIKVVYDTAYFVKNRLSTIISNGLIGFGLVLITLFIFLNFKVAFWTAMGIPVALFIGAILMKSIGLSIDVITMGSIIMVLGMLVDDAIIVGENIYRHRLDGLSPMDAAYLGIKETSAPVICTVLTTVLTFTPLFGIKGMMGKFIWAIPVVISITLLGSLFDCFFILPNHITHTNIGTDEKNSKEKLISFLQERYIKLLAWALKFRYLVIFLFVFVFASSMYIYDKFIPYKMFPQEASELFFVKIEGEKGDTIDKTANNILPIEKAIWSIGGEDLMGMITHIGSKSEWGVTEGASYPHQAIIFTYLTPASTRISAKRRTAKEIMEKIREKTANLPGLKKINFIIDAGGPPTGRPIDINIHCDNDNKRQILTSKVFKYIKGLKGVQDLERLDDNKFEQIDMIVDYHKLSSLGLTVSDIAQTIRLAFDGLKTAEIIKNNEVIEVKLGFSKKYRMDTKNLLNLGVRNNLGKIIKVSRFAKIGKRYEDAVIFHQNGEVTTKIVGELDENTITPKHLTQKVMDHFKSIFASETDASMTYSGEAETTGKSISDLLRSFVMALAMIYLILLLLFNSLSQPLLIMIAIPFSLIGVVFTLLVHNLTMSFMSAIGVIGLCGVVVNDSLVMVSFINDYKKRGGYKSLIDLIIDAAKLRLRPIILTTVTTVCGLLPTAYGLGGSDIYVRRMVLPMAWGLIFATMLTLILIPCLYHIDQDIKSLFHRSSASR